MERKGKWWREYTKQHLENGVKAKPAPEPDTEPEPVVQPMRVPASRTFRIKISPPRQVQQALKLTPYQKFKAWVFRHIGKIFFGMALLLIRHILKKQSRR